MITIACPVCAAKLRVDPAFQGRTCRCTHCDAMLAVPSDAARMPVRVAPGGANGSPAASRAGRSGSGAGSATSTGSQMQDVYSGNSVPALMTAQAPLGRASAEPLISLQEPRGGNNNHAAIIAGAAGAGVLILAIGVLLVVLIAGKSGSSTGATAYASGEPRSLFDTPPPPTPTVTPTPAPQRTPERAPAVEKAPVVDDNNPLTWQIPTVLGEALAGQTAVLVDAVDLSKPWIDDVNASLLQTLAKTGEGERVSIFYLHDGEVDGLPRQPLAPGRALRSSLARLQRTSEAGGKTGFYDGLQAAINAEPDHVFVITGRTKWAAAAEHILGLMKDGPSKPSFNVISMSGPDEHLDEIAKATGGIVQPLEPETLAGWLED